MSTRNVRSKPLARDFQELVSRVKKSETYDKEVVRAEISDQIDRLMRHQSITKAELARRLQMSRAYVTKMLQGNANFTLDSLVQIARVLNCKYVPAFVPMNLWKQFEAVRLSASAKLGSQLRMEAYGSASVEIETDIDESNTSQFIA